MENQDKCNAKNVLFMLLLTAVTVIVISLFYVEIGVTDQQNHTLLPQNSVQLVRNLEIVQFNETSRFYRCVATPVNARVLKEKITTELGRIEILMTPQEKFLLLNKLEK